MTHRALPVGNCTRFRAATSLALGLALAALAACSGTVPIVDATGGSLAMGGQSGAGGSATTGGTSNGGTSGVGGSTPGSCPSGQVFCPGCTPGTGQCYAGGCPGVACGSCTLATTQTECDARAECHSVFVDPGTCGCMAIGCCAQFSRCADGATAQCTPPSAQMCDAPEPFCESPAFVVSYAGYCYEGCVRSEDCAN